jgi:hypothetical protein
MIVECMSAVVFSVLVCSGDPPPQALAAMNRRGFGCELNPPNPMSVWCARPLVPRPESVAASTELKARADRLLLFYIAQRTAAQAFVPLPRPSRDSSRASMWLL